METAALRAAIALTLMPSRIRSLRDGPLPEGVSVLLRIAAGEEEIEREAAMSLDRPAHIVRDASVFFIEQMLLFPEANSYRVLGTDLKAPTPELRQNMALLIRWLHPDKNPTQEQTVFVYRVNRAWDDLKTPDRRQAYDRWLVDRPAAKSKPLGPSRDKHQRHPKTRDSATAPSGTTRRGTVPGATHMKRQLMVSDLLGPAKPGRVGIFRRIFIYLLTSKR
jgi:DnaJ domain